MLDGLTISDAELREIDKIVVAACGTAYHAGLVAKYAIEHWTRIPVEVELASEFRYRDPILNRQTLVVAISQSGETMDTLMAVRHAREQGSRVLSICNTPGARRSRGSPMPRCTPTPARRSPSLPRRRSSPSSATQLFGMYLAQVRGNFFGDEIRRLVSDLASMPNKIDLVLDTMDGTGTRPWAQGRPLGAVPRPARGLPGGP